MKFASNYQRRNNEIYWCASICGCFITVRCLRHYFFFAEIFQTVIDRSMILSLQRRLRLSVCYIKLLFNWECIFRICNLPLVSNMKMGLCFLLLAFISQNSGGRSLHFPPNNVASFSFFGCQIFNTLCWLLCDWSGNRNAIVVFL